MPVRNVYDPENREDIDPVRTPEDTGQGPRYWEQKERTARAKREFEEQERQAKQGRENENNPPPEEPFKIRGSFNIGDIDLQKNANDLQNTINTISKEAREREEKLSASNADYRDKVSEIRSQMVENTFKAYVDNLSKDFKQVLAANQSSGNAGMVARFEEIAQIAGMLGYSKPDPAAAQEAMPATIQLQILKMEMEEKGRERQFKWDQIESERNWQLSIKKMELEAQGRRDEMSLERDKRASIISPFESIGAALARGFSDMGSGGEEPPQQKVRKKAPKGKTASMTAGMNDSGTIECNQCSEPIAIAPKARSAFCPSCETTIQIERIPGTPNEEALPRMV
ncbi:MAG TPA: hypothetical protein ENI27_07220 [bacterium]|nr:hypothetical protein [bacterium]